MVKDIRPLKDNMHNADWFNAVRKAAGSDFENRVTEATKANIQDNINNLWNVPDQRNQFIDALINRIGLVLFRNLSWTNPLAKFKRGILEYGDSIEEIMAGLLEASSYDANRDELEKEIFGAMTPEVQVSYHKVDRRDKYKLTVREAEVRKAFITAGGVTTFMTNLMSMLQNSDQWDEYLIMSNLFSKFDGADGFFNINVPDLSDMTGAGGDDARVVLKQLRRMGNTLPFISRLYNPAGLPVAAQRNELELFITAEADAAIDVDALSAAFNSTKAEFSARKTVLPAESFGIDGVQCILTTRDLFVCADQKIEMTSAYNPSALLNNYWLHHWGAYSMSRFAPVVMFNSVRPSTTITVEETPVTGMEAIVVQDATATTVTSVERGQTYNVMVNATTTPAGGSNDAVLYTVAGTGATAQPLSGFTYITNNGDLFIGPDEHNEEVTVTVFALDNLAVTGTTVLGVTGDLIEPWPNPKVLPDSDNDGLLEVTPDAPTFVDNVITIPGTEGVQYKNGATNVAAGTQITVANGTPVTITAVAKTGYELAAGATASWTFTYVAP